MKKLNLLYIILLGIILTNCGNTKNGENSIFTIDNSGFKPFFTAKDVLKVSILNPNSKTIDSILAQTYSNFELLIINDGSTDKTCEIIKSLTDKRVKHILNTAN
ncbi:MAG: glycosyltransferase family 2 protein, partial [Flavobacterium sp.]